MTTDILAIALSVLSLAGTLFNVWLKLQIRAGQLEMEKSLLQAIDKKYATQEVVGVKFAEHDRRLGALEGKRWT